VPYGYKEVDNALYATPLATVPQTDVAVELVCLCVPYLCSFTEMMLLLKYYQ
jgi:hypothetical protein